MGLKGEVAGSAGVYARIKILCLYKVVDMKKLIACSLTFLIAIAANATNWVEIANYKQENDFYYIDTDSMNVTSKEYQMVTAFFKTNKMDFKVNGKTAYSSRQQWGINCRNRSYSILAVVFYDLNGRVIDRYEKGISFVPYRVAHPDTLVSDILDETCSIAGFNK